MYDDVRSTLDGIHAEGTMKSLIMGDPERYVVLEPETPLALLDQKHAGKKLILITELRVGLHQRDDDLRVRPVPSGRHDLARALFDVVIVAARKPMFFGDRNRLFEVVDEEKGLLAPSPHRLTDGGVFLGGSARLVEEHFGLTGNDILYVGDHLFGDVQASKERRQWADRTDPPRDEDEIQSLYEFAPTQARLTRLMKEKEAAEREVGALRLALQRRRRGYADEDAPEEAALTESIGGGEGSAGGAGRRGGAARARVRPARQRALGAAHAGRQRQEPVRAAGGALRRRLHQPSGQLPRGDAVRLPAPGAQQPPPRSGGPLSGGAGEVERRAAEAAAGLTLLGSPSIDPAVQAGSRAGRRASGHPPRGHARIVLREHADVQHRGDAGRGASAVPVEAHFEQDMILQAPLLLTFLADWRRMIRWCGLSEATPGYDNFLSFLVAFSDAFIAAQNAALAAEAHGLGICYMGTTLCNTTKLIDFFGLPENVFPATTMVVGVPDENPELRARLPMEGIVHQETYRDPDDDSVRATYRSRETEGWNRYMSFPDLAKEMRESGVKNLAQVYTQLKYTREDNEEISAELLGNLKRQGFLDE